MFPVLPFLDGSPPLYSVRRAIGVLYLLPVFLAVIGCQQIESGFPAQRADMVKLILATAADEYPSLSDDPYFQSAITAVKEVPRERFVPETERVHAYQNRPLPIGYDQTISDAYIVTVMTAAVQAQRGSNILEIGTGSGYQAAILSKIGSNVHSVEIVEPLAQAAQSLLDALQYPNITVKAGDGFQGWQEFAPYDAIIVTAGASKIPQPLMAQLKIGGKLVMPIGPQGPLEQLILVTKTAADGLTRCSLGPAMFVPLTGRGRRPDHSLGLYDRSIPACYPGQRAVWARER